MRKTIFIAVMLIAAGFAFASPSRDVKDPVYLKYKEQVIFEIKEKLESNGLDKINIQAYISGIDYLRERNGRLFMHNPSKNKNCKNDLRQSLSEYEQAIDEFNAVIEVKKAFIQANRERLYKEAVSKYFPVDLKDLTERQRNEMFNLITNGRNLYKSEWDLKVSQYHMQTRGSIGKVYSVGSGKSEVREALNWLTSQEALWYLGYVGRFTDDYEYRSKLREIENERINVVLYSEEKGLYK